MSRSSQAALPAPIGGYTPLEVVDRHGLFVTARARHELGHEVLLHTVAEHVVPRAELWAELEAEARLSATLPHDAVSGLLELAVEGERRAVVYQAPDGPSFREVLERAKRRGRLSPSEALALLVALTRSLAELHERGVAHGGLCPERCTLSSRTALVRLRDLRWPGHRSTGARPQAVASPGEGALEELGHERASYRAPEQILGAPGSPSSDVFVLGLIGYELLAGKHPFEGESSAEVARRIRHAEVPAIAERPTRVRFARSHADDLELVIGGMLAKSDALRPANALEVLRELEPLARDVPLQPTLAHLLARLELAPERKSPPAFELGRGSEVRALAPRLAGVALAMALATAYLAPGSTRSSSSATSASGQPGRIRVLARPWAEVHLDGQRVDVTPLGAPIEVRPGVHELVFRHPSAPEELRTVEVGPGQSITVEVVLAVERPLPPPVDPSP